MAKQFSGNDSARWKTAASCSSSARTAIADIAIAARLAANKPASGNGGKPTNAINRVRQGGWITAITSASAANAADKPCKCR